jgi:glycosyltransferase involved in cell wall biosynthesis
MLATSSSNPPATRDRLRRILFVSCNYSRDYSKMTWGTYIRMQQLLQGACVATHELDVLLLVTADVVATVDPTIVAESLRRDWGVRARVRFGLRSPDPRGLIKPFVQSLTNFADQPFYRRSSGSTQVAEVAKALDDDVELILIHRLDVAIACIEAARGRVPVAMNLDSIEHQEIARRVAVQGLKEQVTNIAERLRLGALKKGELRVLGDCASLLVCSENERAYLVEQGLKSRIDVVPNARDFDDARLTSNADADGRSLLFFGSYGYPPNVQAAEEMITRIFPLVRAERPDARLLIAGNLVERLPSFAANLPGVEMVRNVVDVADVYRRIDVACCPIRAGGGTRIKVIEACSWKKAIVSTRIGAEGLDLVDGVDILLRDDAADFAKACVRLLEDPAAAHQLGQRAFDKARAEYDRPLVVERIAKALVNAVEPVSMRPAAPLAETYENVRPS